MSLGGDWRRRHLDTSHHSQEAITMRFFADHGRVYRRCGCHDTHRHQLGTHCHD
ncbi:hypothetical protein ACFV42_38565 [Streptomyces solisilvae]|uniref:hypothetical protein n=1 Tax=Streptomyces malaysiensis TaxID=92644 RepID=UPI0036741846